MAKAGAQCNGGKEDEEEQGLKGTGDVRDRSGGTLEVERKRGKDWETSE